MTRSFVSHSVEETIELGRMLSEEAAPDSCYVLTGDLGACTRTSTAWRRSGSSTTSTGTA